MYLLIDYTTNIVIFLLLTKKYLSFLLSLTFLYSSCSFECSFQSGINGRPLRIFRRVYVDIQCGTNIAVPKDGRYGLHIHLVLYERRGKGVAKSVELDAMRQPYLIEYEVPVVIAEGPGFAELL